jgi:hypothetical protein
MKHLFPLESAFRVVALAVLLAAGVRVCSAQSQTACGEAVKQLQTYVQQVNAIANLEYNQGISRRCGFNGYCAQSLLQQLTAWYSQQSMLINQWYSAIARQCSPGSQRRPSARKPRTDPTDEIEDVDDLQVDDEDKSVRIRIPSKPNAFSSRSR